MRDTFKPVIKILGSLDSLEHKSAKDAPRWLYLTELLLALRREVGDSQTSSIAAATFCERVISRAERAALKNVRRSIRGVSK